MQQFYLRKLVHISLIFILLIEAVFGKCFTLAVIFFVTSIYAISEILRIKGKSFPLIQRITVACTEPEKIGMFGIEP
ncbi:MAG: hypothetical protein ACTSV6_05335, partial [Candidatus Heimdallarchaeota archaeon]